MNRRKFRRLLSFICCATGLIWLAGCEKDQEEWVPARSAAVDIGQDGSVTEYLYDRFDRDYYQFDELAGMLDREVAAYNAQSGSERILVESAFSGNPVEDGDTSEDPAAGYSEDEIHLVIHYRSASDYAAFNQTEFYCGSVIGAQLAGHSLDAGYTFVKDGKAEGSGYTVDDVLDHSEYGAVMINSPMEVHVDGVIEFVSDGAKVISEDSAVAESPVGEDDPESPDEEEGSGPARSIFPVYIIYRTL